MRMKTQTLAINKHIPYSITSSHMPGQLRSHDTLITHTCQLTQPICME